MDLTTVWFCLIAVLWIGYFVLEGFDFGVGILLPALAATAGMAAVPSATFSAVAWLVVGLATLTGMGSMILRGLARRLEDDDGEIVEADDGMH